MPAFAIAVLLLLASCSPYELREHHPGERDAAELVWVGLYGMELAEYPHTQYVESECCGERGLPYVTLDGEHGCAAGLYYDQWNMAVMLTEPLLSRTQLAHELMHARMWLRDNDADYGHVRIEWSTLVPEAELLLKEHGL